MAKYIFKNIKTGETKIISSKDSATAKRVYSNKTWEYVKPIAEKDCPKPSNTKVSKEDIRNMWTLSCILASSVIKLREDALEYDVRFARNSAFEMEDSVSKLQSILRKFQAR